MYFSLLLLFLLNWLYLLKLNYHSKINDGYFVSLNMLYIKHSKKIFENVVFKKFIFESYNVRTSRNIKSNIFSLQVCIKIQSLYQDSTWSTFFFFFLVDMKYMLEKSWKCPINPQIRKSTQKAKTYLHRLTKMHMLYYYQKRKKKKKHMLRWSFTVPTGNIGAVEVGKVWSFSYV